MWSSLDLFFAPITILMEVVPDVISNLTRVDTAMTTALASTDPTTTDASTVGTSTSGDDVLWYMHAMDRYGNTLDDVEQQPVLDVYRVDTGSPIRQSFQQQNLLLVDPADGGYHGLFRGVSPASTPGRFERSQCRRALTLVWCATTGTIVNVRPAGQFRVYVRRATLTDIPASLTAYPPNGELDDATEMRGSVLTFDIVLRECVDPASQTPDSDGAECVCRQGFFDADPQDGELVCDPCAVGTYRDNIQDPTCLSCPGTSTTVGTASIAREDCVCNVGCVLGDLFPDPVVFCIVFPTELVPNH